MRVALFGVGHWHFPLYEAALLNSGATIAAVSEAEEASRNRIAAAFQAPAYATHRDLMDGTDFDFAFVFGRHREMAEIADALIRRNKPFSIEKPAGFTHELRDELRRSAERSNLFVSFPLVYRVTPLFGLFERMTGQHGTLSSLSVRCFAGPPGRYLANGSPWMVEPGESGGGSTKNLAPHYVDLFLAFAGSEAGGVSAGMNSLAYGAAVEDYSNLTVRAENGAIATIETGYNFPIQYGSIREFSLVASTPSVFVRASESQVEIFDRSGEAVEKHAWNIDSNVAFAPYVHEVLRRFRDGLPPVVDFVQFNKVMRVIDAGYQSAQQARIVPLKP